MNPLFKVGDTAWWAQNGTVEKTNPCPVCFGKLAVTVILGNGESIQTPCDYCGRGYEGPKGGEKECAWESRPVLFTITGIETQNDGVKQTARYHAPAGYVIDDEDVFATEEEAAAKCKRNADEHNEQERQRREVIKEQAHKSFSWHVGYHRRCIKDLKRQLEWHEARAIACASRAKTPLPTEP